MEKLLHDIAGQVNRVKRVFERSKKRMSGIEIPIADNGVPQGHAVGAPLLFIRLFRK